MIAAKTYKKWAIVGLGRSGKAHFYHLQRLKKFVKIVACADLNRPEWIDNIFFYSDYRDLIAESKKLKIDGLSVCLPIESHIAASILSLKNGLDVICEKPLSLSESELRELEMVINKFSCKLIMISQLLYEPWFNIIKNFFAKREGHDPKLSVHLKIRANRSLQNVVAEFFPHYFSICHVLGFRISTQPVIKYINHNSNSREYTINYPNLSFVITSGAKTTGLKLQFLSGREIIYVENGIIKSNIYEVERSAEVTNRKFALKLKDYPFHTHFGPGISEQYKCVMGISKPQITWSSVDALVVSRSVSSLHTLICREY